MDVLRELSTVPRGRKRRTASFLTGFCSLQGVLEFVMPDRKFFVPDKNFELFGHGGMLFWFVSSVVFAAVGVPVVARCP